MNRNLSLEEYSGVFNSVWPVSFFPDDYIQCSYVRYIKNMFENLEMPIQNQTKSMIKFGRLLIEAEQQKRIRMIKEANEL